MNSLSARSLHADGFIFAAEYLRNKSTAEVARSIGVPVAPPGVTEVQTLIPRSTEDATPNVYSGIHGYSQFPMHTDLAHWAMPPRYMLLRCVVGAPDVPTSLLDSRHICIAVEAVRLRRALVMPRRPAQGTRSLLRLLSGANALEVFRWDSHFLVPASAEGFAAYHEIEERMPTLPRKLVFLTNPGDTLLVDNWRMLHGRGHVPAHALSRKIERIYLTTLQ